jgi:Holliday junction DNA helicase RuvA
MITKTRGKLLKVENELAVLEIGNFEYEILIPDFTRRQLQGSVGEQIDLHTIHYLEGNPAHGRLTPRLIGFISEVEREFFELFCSVDGLGAKKALRAMVRPVHEVAEIIERQDAKALSALPGIGPATADRIVAKLRRKMPKFALLVAAKTTREAEVESNVVEETFLTLCALGHSESDARKLIDDVLAQKRKFKNVDELIQAIYDNRRGT